MCGFTAFVGDRPTNDHQADVTRGAARIRHRGPDDADSVMTPHGVLAHQRLSIIDVEGGRQPLANEERSVFLVCNGEIYNAASLRAELERRHRFATRSDSEVIIHLYEEHGAAMVRMLDGMFAFVLIDGPRFVAARDPFGIKPLYFGRTSDGLWFASELKALPRDCHEITELPAGSVMTETGLTRWFSPTWTEPPTAPDAEDPAALRRVLEHAVDKRLMSDVPLGVFLSGGLDSSIISALVRRRLSSLHSFAVGREGSEDLTAARRVAEHIGTHHHEYVYTDEEATSVVPKVIESLESYDAALIESAVPCWFVSKLAAEHVKVVLSGEGADEIFAGYGYFTDIQDPADLHRECARLLFGLHNMNLQRVDRMTMAHGLEGRVPFLDTEVVHAAMRCDPALKTTSSERPEKWMLRRSVEDLLPREIVWRTKQEFAHGSGSHAVLALHGERAVSDRDFAERSALFPEDTPTTKQAFAYRRIFEEMFPGSERRETVGRWRGRAPQSL